MNPPISSINKSFQSEAASNKPLFFCHESSFIDEGATIDEGTKVWHFCHVQSGAVIGKNCNIGQNVYIGKCAKVGDGCKIQNNVSIYSGVVLEDYVFCGPSCVFTNDLTPRCKYPKGPERFVKTLVMYGASIGANATIVCGITIGRHAMIGAGAVVTKDVLDYALVIGIPARQAGWVCECGELLAPSLGCALCNRRYFLENGKLIS